ncbi:protein PHLOEM PROTEIN 2-LIKE A9-like [Vicia villosa]|uniref:protein PHLOEM PROTEIN 2-LIKE A9-like n=1 Tax=Vicia villosa TaxID=3911 RepID=UPI00273B4879|nr:protein PHLOEM PROTEIN 2-LIKE A9-like [Vicia villosa]
MPFRKPHQTSDREFIDEIKKENSNIIIGHRIKPKGLNIIWGNDLRYWKKTSDDYAELIQVSWLEVSGKVPVERGQTYTVKFDVEVDQNGFGWDNTPVLVMAKIGKKGKYDYKVVELVCDGVTKTIPKDEQLNITVNQDEIDPELHFGLYEVWSGKWKGGLRIKKAEVKKINP